jgi:hypothetical protein
LGLLKAGAGSMRVSGSGIDYYPQENADAAEGRDFLMHARVGVLRALNRHVERVFNPDRKDTPWGR